MMRNRYWMNDEIDYRGDFGDGRYPTSRGRADYDDVRGFGPMIDRGYGRFEAMNRGYGYGPSGALPREQFYGYPERQYGTWRDELGFRGEPTFSRGDLGFREPAYHRNEPAYFRNEPAYFRGEPTFYRGEPTFYRGDYRGEPVFYRGDLDVPFEGRAHLGGIGVGDYYGHMHAVPMGQHGYGYGAFNGVHGFEPWMNGRFTPTPGASFRGRAPKGYKRSDERIREDICDRLMESFEIDPTEIDVRVQNGEVTLLGMVTDRRSKHIVELIAESVPGVLDVLSQLRTRRDDGATRFGANDRGTVADRNGPSQEAGRRGMTT